MSKPVYSGLSILDLSKTVNVWILVWLSKTKVWWKCKAFLYGYRQQLLAKTDDIYKDIAKDVETRSDTANFGIDRPMLKWKK